MSKLLQQVAKFLLIPLLSTLIEKLSDRLRRYLALRKKRKEIKKRHQANTNLLENADTKEERDEAAKNIIDDI